MTVSQEIRQEKKRIRLKRIVTRIRFFLRRFPDRNPILAVAEEENTTKWTIYKLLGKDRKGVN